MPHNVSKVGIMPTTASSQEVSLAYNLTTVNTLTSVISLAGVSYLLWVDEKHANKPLVAFTVILMSFVYIGVTLGTSVSVSTTPGAATGVNPISLQIPCDMFVGTDFYWNFIATPLFLIIMGWSIFVLFAAPMRQSLVRFENGGSG